MRSAQTDITRSHVTSPDIHEASFPLSSIDSSYAVAFHGFREDIILLGGYADNAPKQEIQLAIRNAIAGSNLNVAINSLSNYNGDDPRNIVNWLANSSSPYQQDKTIGNPDEKLIWGLSINSKRV